MITRAIKRLGRMVGLDIRRFDPYRDPLYRLARIAADQEIDLVLDVGANTGQFARQMRHHGYRGTIVSFEPLGAAHGTLVREAAGDAAWQVAPRAALGAEAGKTVTLNIASNLVSSSILPLDGRLGEIVPDLGYVAAETVPLTTLDAVIDAHPEWARRRTLLKIDTQGFEGEVLAGAGRVLPDVRVLFLELALDPVYRGAPRFADMVARLDALGFSCAGIDPGLVDPRSAAVLEVDGIFLRGA